MTDDDPMLSATPLAQEISAHFNKLMAKGGRIDQILAGGIGERAPAASDKEIAFLRRNIDIQLAEYEAAHAAAAEWHAAWKARQPQGFRATRRK